MPVVIILIIRSRFYESSQQRYANVATVTWLARHFETVKFPITSSPRARPSNWANAELYRYKIVAVSLHKTHICVVKSLVKIAAVSWHSLRRFIKPAPAHKIGKRWLKRFDKPVSYHIISYHLYSYTLVQCLRKKQTNRQTNNRLQRTHKSEKTKSNAHKKTLH